MNELLSVNLILKNIKVSEISIPDLSVVLKTVDPELDKKPLIHKALDDLISDKELQRSFYERIVLVYDETIPVEIVTGIHSWLYTKCCDIENIVLIVTHHLGLKDWYNRYLSLFGMKGFSVIEAPLLSMRYKNRFESIQSFQKTNKPKLDHYFSFYGGTYGSLERDFLTAKFSTINEGYVDYMCGYSEDAVKFDNYLESLTRFKDRAAVDQLLAVRSSRQILENAKKIKDEDFSNSGFQFDIDNVSACQVVRETLVDLPYLSVTEKSLRPFLHNQIPIPTGVEGLFHLTQLGFATDYEPVDYRYQFEKHFYTRINQICKVINSIKARYTLEDLRDYINDNWQLFAYNHDYIYSQDLFKNIRQKLLKELDV